MASDYSVAMGLLLVISSLLAWPFQRLLSSGDFPASQWFIHYLKLDRSDSECWLLALLVYSLLVLAIPNLHNLSKRSSYALFIGCLIGQPCLLLIFRWPDLATYIWQQSGSLFLTTLVYGLPGMAVYGQMCRGKRVGGFGWLVLLVALSTCLLCDLFQQFGLNYTALLSHSEIGSSIPWGLVLTLFLSGWLSSLLIPHWFLWVSQAELLVDDRTEQLKRFWLAFHTRTPKIYLWPTGCRFSNAVLVGSAIGKKLLLTDKLLLTFHQRELEWIVLHEMAHVTRCHQLVRLLPTALALPSLYIVLSQTGGIALLLSCVLLLAIFSGLIMATCWWTEWDADSQAIKMGSNNYEINFAQASCEYSEVLRKLYGSNGTTRTSWTHPSLSHRLQAISKFFGPIHLSQDQAN